MIEREHAGLSLTRQCRLLELSRSSVYYRPVGESAQTLALMRRIDELYLQYPFYGSRQMVRHLAREGVRVGRRVRRLMRLLGLEAIYRKPRTSVANPEHRVYPYLLRGLTIERPNQVWCADITYIPCRAGSCTWWRSWTGPVGACWRGGCPTRWTPSSAWRRWRRLWKATVFQRSSTPIRAASSPVSRSRDCWRRPGYAARWTVAVGGDNVFIERLWRSLRGGVPARSRGRLQGAAGAASGWSSTTSNDRTRRSPRTPEEAYRDGAAKREEGVA